MMTIVFFFPKQYYSAVSTLLCNDYVPRGPLETYGNITKPVLVVEAVNKPFSSKHY